MVRTQPAVLMQCLSFLALAAALFAPTDAWAVRCGNRLISDGDSQARVLRYCGEPMHTVQRLAHRHGYFPNRRVTRTLSVDPDAVISATDEYGRNYYYGYTEVIIDEWTYNFGPNKFMRKIIFENGVVVDVETLEYGFHDYD